MNKTLYQLADTVQLLGKMTIATIPEAEIGICIVVSPTDTLNKKVNDVLILGPEEGGIDVLTPTVLSG
jgi:hypothetical protein